MIINKERKVSDNGFKIYGNMMGGESMAFEEVAEVLLSDENVFTMFWKRQRAGLGISGTRELLFYERESSG